jgi:hypothetical protein
VNDSEYSVMAIYTASKLGVRSWELDVRQWPEAKDVSTEEEDKDGIHYQAMVNEGVEGLACSVARIRVCE